MRGVPEVERSLPGRVQSLGFELVQVEWAGSKRRPILRIRIDRSDSRDGQGVTVDDCATVSRALEPWLDSLESVPERYVLEVSSPGVDRPLTKEGDWDRFAGEQVALKGPEPLAGRATYLEGELGGLSREGDRAVVVLRLAGGEELRIPREEVSEARLVFRWK